ncbi:hypothetical protein [Lederbergia citrea]|uniref:hypothetical protein n=1 Tax=Lederbergia citrea TaxID=2833581 RepID=UPI001BC92827|nr:hypothetical protein [Lederbergia citrea]MBS4203644.1 hypothetical protein [Lederbergia citrea]
MKQYRNPHHHLYRLEEIDIIDDDNKNVKKGYVFVDHQGEILDRKKALEYIEFLQEAYSNTSIDEFITESNKQQFLYNAVASKLYSSSLKFEKVDENCYKVNRPDYKKNTFNKSKRDWSFRCSLCNKKVSSKYDESYYLVSSPFDQYFDMPTERTCSIPCADVVYKDNLKRWIKERELSDYVIINF